MVTSRIIVLIPTLNEAAHIAGVVRSLIENDKAADGYTVIVADGGSTDATCNIVRDLMSTYTNLHLMHNPGRTQAAAMNMLLAPEFDPAQVCVRCDAHAFYPPNFVSDTVEVLQVRDVASVVVTMDAVTDPDAGLFGRAVSLIADSRLGAGGSPHRGAHVSGHVDHGHHAAFRMDVFRALDGYDRSFVANEDAEYDRRLIRAGHRIWLAGDIRIGYVPRATPGTLARQYYRYGLGRAATCLKHRVRPQPRQLIPFIHVCLLIISLILIPFSAVGFLWPVFYSALLIGAVVPIAIRHRSPGALLAAPALAIMHTAWGAGFLTGLVRGAPQPRTGIHA